MRKRRRLWPIILVLFLLFTTIICNSCGESNMQPEDAQDSLSKLIEKGSISDLSLTVYYMSPYYFTFAALSIDDLITGDFEEKLVISVSNLEEHINLLGQMSAVSLIPVESESYLNARVYYVFETKRNGKILDVAMWGDEWNIFVNGVEVKDAEIFYDVIMPFLPEEAAEQLKRISERNK